MGEGRYAADRPERLQDADPIAARQWIGNRYRQCVGRAGDFLLLGVGIARRLAPCRAQSHQHCGGGDAGKHDQNQAPPDGRAPVDRVLMSGFRRHAEP